MKITLTLLLLGLMALTASAQQPDSAASLAELERKLDQATGQLEQLGQIVQSLRAEIARLKGESVGPAPKSEPRAEAAALPAQAKSKPAPETVSQKLAERIIEPELGHSERGEELRTRPEIFIQSRYSAFPIRDAGAEFEPNFSLTRIETRWAGKVAERLGAGLEIQFHPAIDSSPEELVNDAFIEYYLNDHATVRVGQFIKPFGFDVQQSSAVREAPERAIFTGYFFPGQRDRGVMLFGDLGFIKSRAFKGVHYFVGAFNGNRFFTDNNRQANVIVRVRKVFERPKLAFGVSMQHGKQLLPPGVTGNNDENIYGLDFQFARGRFGLRGEIAAGNMPSTLLGIEPEFAAAFHPGARSGGGHLFATYSLSARDHIYARYDQFNRDPVKGYNVRAFNFGYFRQVGEASRIGFDYQFKNRPSFNDDAVNGRFHLTWSIEF
jgi:hypothetical protein